MPTTTPMGIKNHGFCARGVKELSTISTAPPEKEKPARMGRATVMPAVIPASRA